MGKRYFICGECHLPTANVTQACPFFSKKSIFFILLIYPGLSSANGIYFFALAECLLSDVINRNEKNLLVVESKFEIEIHF
jgi:hypothetical protein